MPGNRPLRIGVAGLGFGAAVHVPGLRSLADVEVVALAGRDLHRTLEMAKKLGVSNAVCGIDELLALRLDAISLALPPRANGDACQRALMAGVPVLSEKPIAESATNAVEMARLSQTVTTAVDFQFAELKAFAELHQLIERQEYGRVRHVTTTWLVESWVQRNSQWSWKTDVSAYGGALSLLGSHYLYLIEWLCGPIVEISCRLSTRGVFAPHMAKLDAADDTVELWLTHESGAISSAFVSNASPGACIHRWDVVFEQATATLENKTSDYMSGFALTIGDRKDRRQQISNEFVNGVDGRVAPFSRLAGRFVDAVRTGARCTPNFFHGARVQTLIECARKANLARKFISAPKTLLDFSN